MTLVAVIRENIATGRIGAWTHAMELREKQTKCGMSAYTDRANVQLSVEPEGTKITCPRCLARMGGRQPS